LLSFWNEKCFKQEKATTHISYSVTFFLIALFVDNVEKYIGAGEARDENMAYVHFMLGTQGYKHMFRICNTYCFSTATMIAQMSFSVTLQCMACLVDY
jgi:hypothetical protein